MLLLLVVLWRRRRLLDRKDGFVTGCSLIDEDLRDEREEVVILRC